MRLQKFLAQAGVASRRRAEELIKSGAVRVNGAVVESLGHAVDIDRDTIEVEGKRVRQAAAMYRLVLKPRACLSTLASPKPAEPGQPPRDTLARYVHDREIAWHVVAPLDYPAEGVLLLTTDGDLAEQMSRGGGRVPMTYHIKFQGRVGDEEVGRLLRGWHWERRPVKPDSVVALATTGKNTWVEIVVREHRPRVIKAAGNPIRKSVLKISRVRLGPLSFEGLAMGESRDLSKAEVNALRRSAGIGGDPTRAISEAAPKPINKTGTKPERRPARQGATPAPRRAVESKPESRREGGPESRPRAARPVLKKRREQDGARPDFGFGKDRPRRPRPRA
ncbi:MAG TPA: S4 domain-containing protein [Polyangia bacterium]